MDLAGSRESALSKMLKIFLFFSLLSLVRLVHLCQKKNTLVGSSEALASFGFSLSFFSVSLLRDLYTLLGPSKRPGIVEYILIFFTSLLLLRALLDLQSPQSTGDSPKPASSRWAKTPTAVGTPSLAEAGGEGG